MGHIGGKLTLCIKAVLQLFKHGVKAVRQPVQLIGSRSQFNTSGQIPAFLYLKGRIGNLLDGPQHPSGDQISAYRSCQHQKGQKNQGQTHHCRHLHISLFS